MAAGTPCSEHFGGGVLGTVLLQSLIQEVGRHLWLPGVH